MEKQLNSGIYCIRNIVTGKRYVGKTVNFVARFEGHLDTLRKQNHNTKLQHSYNKHSESSFVFDIIERLEPVKELLNEREKYWINFYNSFYEGYNMTLGGDGGWGWVIDKNSPHYAEICNKISKKLKGSKLTEEQCKKISERLTGLMAGDKNPMYGRHHSEETKTKLSELAKARFATTGGTFLGHKHSEETKTKLSEIKTGEKHPMYGKHQTEETKAKRSKTMKGRTFTDEHKEKIRLSWIERRKRPKVTFSDEHKEKISKALKGRTFTDEHRRNISISTNAYYNKRRNSEPQSNTAS